ncbi:Variant surface glycoprotein [Trypanosoma congolense IL3000]|uniref:Variant surface glycoprotein n=1 Tax=Trypanosoma congolense (strain IL3000) TaxID=1068625 RepID=F9WEP9_TRYCI|nr:Variant surface glycoprotein [Trypanosoma congolense IL3000]
MVIGNFALVTLFGLVFYVGSCSAQPSKDEFNLFCRILWEVNYMIHGPEYVYDETKDAEIVKEMQVLYNATTDDMGDFRKMLWERKDFFEKYPPPTDAKNRHVTHREIGQLLMEGEKKIKENRELAEKVNQKMEEAKLPATKGMYGDNVKGVPKEDGDWTAILNDNASIFGSASRAEDSCGNGEKTAGKTLINDLFCVCVGGEADNAEGPCHPKIWPPKSWKDNGGTGEWTQIKYGTGNLKRTRSFLESIEKIEKVCDTLLEEKDRTRNMPALLDEYVKMIGKGDENVKKNKENKIFGHSGRSKERGEVKECDGRQGSQSAEGSGKNNEKICVDYTATLKQHKEIPWHTKFREASDKMDQTKHLEEKILKNQADLLLLKNKAWIAYTREKEDDTANLDDMNMSHLFDATQPPPSFPLPHLLLIL